MAQVPTILVHNQYGANSDTSATPAVATEQYEVLSWDHRTERVIVNTAGMRGTRSEVLERLRQGTIAPKFQIRVAPTPSEMRKWLARILGGSEQSGAGDFTYALAESLPAFQWIVNYGGGNGSVFAKNFTFCGCKVDKAVFHCTAGQPLELTMDCEALTETQGNQDPFTGISIASEPPFMIFDTAASNGSFKFGGTAYQVQEITLTIDNLLKKDRFVNSQTRTDLPETARKVTIDALVPYTTDTVALYDGGAAGITSALKFAVGGAGGGGTGTSLEFVLQKVVFPARGLRGSTKQEEQLLPLSGQIYMTAGTPEVSAILDVTP